MHGGVLSLALLAGYLVPVRAAAEPVATITEPQVDRELAIRIPLPQRLSCAAAMEELTRYVIIPTAISAESDSESIEFDVQISTKEAARATYALEIYDDKGTPFGDPVFSGTLELPGEDIARGTAFTTPADLPDGYYQVRLTGATLTESTSKHGAQTQVFSTGKYFRVNGGVVELMSLTSWLMDSVAMEAVHVPEGASK
jgi:hypothetical protein